MAGPRVIAELKPIELVKAGVRPFGFCRGEFVVPEDFEAALTNKVLQSFED